MVATIVVLLNRQPEVQVVVEHYQRPRGGRGVVVTPDNVEEVRQMLEEQEFRPEDARFQFSLVPNWTFPTSRTPSPDARVRNVETNSRTVFFDVVIEELDRVVYVSPYMPLGTEHRGFALDYDLEPGTYSAIVTYFLVDDDFQILTDVSVGVTITVES